MNMLRGRQKGMGMSAILFDIVVVVVTMTVIFRLGPSYMGFWTLRSVMNGVAESPEPILGGKPAIMRVVENRMMVNDIRNIDPRAFKVTKVGDEAFELAVAYERREHLFFNIDAVLSFNYAVTVKGK